MGANRISHLIVGVVVAAWAIATVRAFPTVSAERLCPDIEVVFARGTDEAPGVGGVGNAFVDSLRSRVDGKSVGVYAVRYPASDDFSKATDGARDANAHVQLIAATCPGTRIVLGGFSQGAGVVDLMTVPQASMADYVVAPLPTGLASHVAAVAVFGNPGAKMSGAPLTEASPVYGTRTIDLCIHGDPICSDGGNILVHGLYVQFGKATEAAAFAASRL